MCSMLPVAFLCSQLIMINTSTLLVNESDDWLAGKWTGELAIGEAKTTFMIEFKKNGQVELTVLDVIQSWSYRVLQYSKLEFTISSPDGRGGRQTTTMEVPFRVTRESLQLELPKREITLWPGEYKRVR